MKLKTFDSAYLYCFPLNVEKVMSTASELKCYHLIWLKCCYSHSFKNVIVTKKDREMVGLPRRSYMRGLEELEKLTLITVDRKVGRSCCISLNLENIDRKIQDIVLKGRETP